MHIDRQLGICINPQSLEKQSIRYLFEIVFQPTQTRSTSQPTTTIPSHPIPPSKHISKPRTKILHRNPLPPFLPPPLLALHLRRRRRPLHLHGAVHAIKLPILVHQQGAQPQHQQRGEEHKRRAHRLALDVQRFFAVRVQARAEERSALADEVEQDDAGAAAGVAALVVCGSWVSRGAVRRRKRRGGKWGGALLTQNPG
jgi:hypothetical protein